MVPPQDDVLYETLTVYETLQFAALLRLPPSMPRAKKLARVDNVIDVLGLQRSRDTIIGGFLRRGLSGVGCFHRIYIHCVVSSKRHSSAGLE